MDFREQLKLHGYKLTKQRQAILDVMQHNHDRLLSVEALNDELNQSMDLSTIYRNLEILDSCGLMHKVQQGDKALYKLICHDHHHHHLICLQCGTTEVIDYCPIAELDKIAKQHKFQVQTHSLEVFGICQACQAKL